jgi:hypothetical protein
VKVSPFKHKAKRPVRELAVDGARFDFYRDLEFPVYRMEVRLRSLRRKEGRNGGTELLIRRPRRLTRHGTISTGLRRRRRIVSAADRRLNNVPDEGVSMANISSDTS